MKLINILLVLMGLVCTERLCANEQFNITQFKPREKQKDIIRISIGKQLTNYGYRKILRWIRQAEKVARGHYSAIRHKKTNS